MNIYSPIGLRERHEDNDPEQDDRLPKPVEDHKSEISGVESHGKIVAADKITLARVAGETRPKNIKVVFLMKCLHLGKESVGKDA